MKGAPQLLTVKQASQQFNLKESFLRSLIFKREIPFLKIKSLIRFDQKEIQSWLLAQNKGVK